MKKLIIFCLFLTPALLKAQMMPHYDCGTWVADSVKITECETIDTLKKPVKTTERNWIESPLWERNVPMFTNAVYSPCGGDPSYVEYKWRVCSITGIRQKKYRIYQFHYVDPVKSEYQKIIDKFK